MRKPFGFWIKTSKRKVECQVIFDDVGGLSSEDPVILVDSAARGRRLLENWIHEGIHSERRDLTEREVEHLADFVSRLLWRAGYRWPERRRVRHRKRKVR